MPDVFRAWEYHTGTVARVGRYLFAVARTAEMIARPASPCLGFDCSARVTRVQARALWELNYRWAGRTLALPGLPAQADADELEMLAATGFDVSLYQRVRFPGWNPANHSGVDDGNCAADQARAAGSPLGCHVYLDLEGIAGTKLATATFAEDWAAAVLSAGYLAGLYVGYDVPLDANELYDLHGITSYWSDAGPRAVATRGFSIKQLAPEAIVAGLKIDRDNVRVDLFGDMPMCAASRADGDAVS